MKVTLDLQELTIATIFRTKHVIVIVILLPLALDCRVQQAPI
jgi:hypothetical protein